MGSRTTEFDCELIQAAAAGDLVLVHKLVEDGADIEVQNNEGHTALMKCAEGGCRDVLCFLVEHGAVIDAKDNDGNTALLWASWNGHLEMVRYLVEHGADIETKNNYDRTALTRAAWNDNHEVVLYLVDHGASIDGTVMMPQPISTDVISDACHQLPRLLIKSVSSGHYLDGRSSGLLNPRLDAENRKPSSDSSLQWVIGDAGNGHVFIKSVSSGQYLDGRKPGMPEPLLSSEGRNPATDAYLKWVIGDAENGHVFIKSVSSGQYLDGRNPRMSDPILSSGERNPANDGYLQWIIESKDCKRFSALEWATLWGPLEMVRGLVKHVATLDSFNNDGRTLLIWAAFGGHINIVRSLVEKNAAVNTHDSDGRTPLMWAAKCGHLDVVRFLVEHGAAVNASSSNGSTPLMYAAVGGHLDTVRLLVLHGAAVDASSSDCFMPLMWATISGHLDMVRFLVKHGATVDARDSNGRIPLVCAAGSGRMDMVHRLVDLGATVDAHDSNGMTALMQAARGGHMEMVQFLVDKCATADDHDINKETALLHAACNGHLDIVRFLVEHGAAVNACNSDGLTPLIYAVSNDHLGLARFLVEQGAAVNTTSSDSSTPLIYATRGGHLDMVRLLVDHGAAINVCNSDGLTPLLFAAIRGHQGIVHFLVGHGAADVARNCQGVDPLMWSAFCGHLDVVRILIDHGAAVDARNSGGMTPLMISARNGHKEVVCFLVKHGAAVNACDNDGMTPLMYSADGGRLEVVRILVEHGAALEVCSTHGVTPLMYSVRGGHLDVVRFFMEHKVAVDTRDNDGWTPLMYTARDGHLDMLRIFADNGAAVNGTSNDEWTPLMLAACDGHVDLVNILVEKGANMNVRSNGGWTPLMWASKHGHLEVVRFLVKHGADVNLLAESGDTTLSCAAQFGHQEIVNFLVPRVRYQHHKYQTGRLEENMAQHSKMPYNWLIAPFEIEVEPFDDAGRFGGDYRGKWLDADVVVKLFVDAATSATFVDEVRLWHQLRHPNVLKLYGVCTAEHHLFICEYASNGSLPEYLKSCGAERRTPWKFLYETALGLEYLHERNIVHGNLRGSNILIGSDGLAKLSGFGLSASSQKGVWSISNAWVRWASPEALRNNRVTFASDVYSMGMCIVETISGNIPFSGRNERDTRYFVKYERTGMSYLYKQMAILTEEQQELVRVMCCDEPRERIQVPVVVNKLEEFARMEASTVAQLAEPESLITFDEFDRGKMNSLWIQVQILVDQSENAVYHQIFHDLKLIYDTLKANSHPWSTLQRFHDLLRECRNVLDTMSQQNRVYRLSATRARDHNVQGLHRRISQLLQHVCPQDQDAETRESEWKRLCRDQVEVFVSEASEAYVLLKSVDSEEDRSALVAVLRAELCNTKKKYTEKQVEVLQKAHDEIVSKSLEDVHLATTPEWFIPWFELEMNEMTTLGEGGFGSVIKARWLDSEVVVKKLEIADKDAANIDKKRKMRQMFEREVDIWFGLSHPHVVRLFGACHVGRPFFVCELAPNGTLVEYLRHHPDELWVKLREAALGVQYLHARGIVHGDLKGNNILIGSDGKAKVTDFGLSDMFGDDSAEVMVTGAWHWVAPECLLGQRPTFASDIYSLGMCIIEALRVINGTKYPLPFGDLPHLAVKYQITKLSKLPCRPQNCSDEAWTLIERMCKSDSADRMLSMTVVDKLEKLADRRGEFSNETDEIINEFDKMHLESSVTEALAEMKNWIVNSETNRDWEMDVLTRIYKLLWNRLDKVATQLLTEYNGAEVALVTISDFSTLVERLQWQTREVLGIAGVIPLAKFTELTLGAYGSHRRLDKFMAALKVSNEFKPVHNWTSECSKLMGVSANLNSARIEEGQSVVKVVASFIQFVCRDYTKPIQNMTFKSRLSIKSVREIREEINGYFIKQVELTDLKCQQEILHSLDSWLEKIKKQVAKASESVLDNLPQIISASNTAQLTSVFETIYKAVKQELQASTMEFKKFVTGHLEKRQGLAVNSFIEIQQFLTKFGIVLPAEMKPKILIVSINTPSENGFLYELNACMANMVDLIQIKLAETINHVVRVKMEPGSVYDAEHDFGGKSTSDNVEIHGRFIRGDDHAKIGHHMNLQMSCQIGSAYVGQSFLLELTHLTSHIEKNPLAPVTVRVNGHTIRESFCPRALHGVCYYVIDRWHVRSSFIHEGENIVSFTYCDHGTSYYWVRSIGLRCALPWTSTTEAHTQDVVKIFDAAMTATMELGLEQKLLFERVLQETSPMLALKAAFQHYFGFGISCGNA